MRPRPNTVLLCTMACAAVASCAHGAAPPAGHSVAASFVCDGGRKIQAVFASGAQPGVKLALSDGREMLLPQAISASGARYANRDESFVFWNKGRTAFIEEAGHQTYTGCVQTK